MKPTDFRLRERLRVRWSEIDAQKIVFNGHYLMYFDTAVAAYWRATALPYASTMEALGGDLFVRKATLDYRASARYDDRLEVGMRCARIGTSSIGFEGAAFRQGDLLVGVELVYVFADPATQTSRPVPAALRDVFDAFESGEPMTELRCGGWNELGAGARKVRAGVFAAGLEAEVDDDAAVHALVANRLGEPLATGRWVAGAPGTYRIERIAVVQALRGGGLGRSVLDTLVAEALGHGDREVEVRAPVGAEAFFRGAGFVPRGEVLMDSGLPHIEMVLAVR